MIALLGLVAGIVVGLIVEPSVPGALQPYLPIAVVAALDATFGALRAFLDGEKKKAASGQPSQPGQPTQPTG